MFRPMNNLLHLLINQIDLTIKLSNISILPFQLLSISLQLFLVLLYPLLWTCCYFFDGFLDKLVLFLDLGDALKDCCVFLVAVISVWLLLELSLEGGDLLLSLVQIGLKLGSVALEKFRIVLKNLLDGCQFVFESVSVRLMVVSRELEIVVDLCVLL